jgi:hypothetical protein
MDDRRWFLLNQGQIRGPFDQAQIESEIPNLPTPLIWGRGQPEWMGPEKWRKALEVQVAQAARARAPERMWRVRIGEEELRPLTSDQMIDALKD